VDAGRLDQRVELYRRDIGLSATGSGAPLEDWTLVTTVWAQVDPVSGSEQFSAQQRTAAATTRFKMRHRSDVSATSRLKWRGTWYDVAEVIPGGMRLSEWIDVAASASPAENPSN